MKFIAEKSALLKVCDFVCPVAATSSPIPILGCVKIAASERLTLTATDTNTEAVASCNANISQPGIACVPTDVFRNLVRAAPNGAQIEVELKGGQVVIRSGKSIAKLGVQAVRDFPARDIGEQFSSSGSLSPSEFSTLFGRVGFAQLTKEVPFYLRGVQLSVRNDLLISQATDIHVIARFVMAAPEGLDDMPTVIVPLATVVTLQKLAEMADGPISLSVGETLVGASIGDFSLSSKVIDGVFPDFDRVIPDLTDDPIRTDRKALVGLIGNLSRLVERAADKMRECVITLSDGTAEIVGKLPNGDFRDEAAIHYRGRSVRTCLNVTDFFGCISSLSADEVEIHITEGKPWVLRDTGDSSGSLVVIAPRRG